ncbi:gamma subclass chorismate mutase AroQ [Roseibium sp. RKSG952]|uniref:gamma subclass chorismate mutase AroQ n=1 Tax=Roseibium sp. RKSG952 TaxID=2529384 RepID=UPI0012BB70EF|nr:gamma subclass chorismate mutase AroQ [Roseibium sp. RKSG952]MTH96874.1 gamma subclass chorismate mutase AroQ [Roseibium sp. RKSG952]
MRPKTVKALVILGALTLVLPGKAFGSPEALFEAINERLEYMEPVAAFKLKHNDPVDDPAREAVVLKAATRQAVKEGLPASPVEAFFQAQMNAAKNIQNCWIARWGKGDPVLQDAPDLKTVVRPQLISLGDKIIKLMADETVTPTDLASYNATVNVKCLSPAAKQSVFEALLQVQNASKAQ